MLRLGIGPKLAAGIMLVPMLKAGVGGGVGDGTAKNSLESNKRSRVV